MIIALIDHTHYSDSLILGHDLKLNTKLYTKLTTANSRLNVNFRYGGQYVAMESEL